MMPRGVPRKAVLVKTSKVVNVKAMVVGVSGYEREIPNFCCCFIYIYIYLRLEMDYQ